MNLGELFYFTKAIDSIKSNLTPEKVEYLELFSVDKKELEHLKLVSSSEIPRAVKDIFLASLLKLINKSDLKFAKAFWNNLASPLAKVSQELSSSTDYQESLKGWLNSEADLSHLPDMLSQGYLTTTLEDYICFYALAVLEALSPQIPATKSKSSQKEDKSVFDKITFSKNPEILVLANNYLSPIFKNFNCLTLDFSPSTEQDISNIIETSQANPEIKLILITQTVEEKTIHLLEKKLKEDVIVSYVNLQSQAKDSYFDDLVRATLGVRLT